MNLDNLKPAWKQYQLANAVGLMDHHEILEVLERAERMKISKSNRYVICTLMFIVLTCCCQGG